MALEIDKVVCLFVAQGYYLRWDPERECYVVIRKVDQRPVARVWVTVEVLEGLEMAEA